MSIFIFMSDSSNKKGRGAQINTQNHFLKHHFSRDCVEGIDDWEEGTNQTQFYMEQSKTILNKVTSPDLPMQYSLNPYQGCEHGCIYCYARNSHEYWGYSAGLDFERKIIIKHNAVALLQAQFEKKSWEGAAISLSGNTDCYQPIERKMGITRQLLALCLEYKNPIGIITKNALILRDLDILQEMAKNDLISVFTSITSLDESLRMKMEPRTTTYRSRLQILETLSKAGIHTGVMNAPIIFGINDQDMPQVLKASADSGAQQVGYTLARLNGSIGIIFKDWLLQHFPDRADKVWNMIAQSHGGQVNDSRYQTRMKGEGVMSTMFAAQFKLMARKYGLNIGTFKLSSEHFHRPDRSGQLKLF